MCIGATVEHEDTDSLCTYVVIHIQVKYRHSGIAIIIIIIIEVVRNCMSQY